MSCAERSQHHASVAYCLPGRRAGLGRRDHALYRPHALAERDEHRRRRRSAPSEGHRPHRSAGGLALAQGARGGRHHAGQPREARPSGLARVRRRPRHLRRVAPGRPKAHLQMDDGRARRASLRFRRPLRLHLADRRRLCRQHRDDPRSRRSRPSARRSGAGGFPGSGRAGASLTPGTATCRRAATIRSGRATAFT